MFSDFEKLNRFPWVQIKDLIGVEVLSYSRICEVKQLE